MRVRIATADDIDGCVEILRLLPDYLTVSAHAEARAMIGSSSNLAMVGEFDGQLVAFVSAERRYPHAAEITHAAVRPGLRNQGLGTMVLEALLDALASRGISAVEVKTLDASSNYEPFEATRRFWEGRGFVQIDCIDPLPGWDVGSPCAIYVKTIRSG
jgi:ribosomal protein S18 acetylase RimI-like enzyme